MYHPGRKEQLEFALALVVAALLVGALLQALGVVKVRECGPSLNLQRQQNPQAPCQKTEQRTQEQQ